MGYSGMERVQPYMGTWRPCLVLGISGEELQGTEDEWEQRGGFPISPWGLSQVEIAIRVRK